MIDLKEFADGIAEIKLDLIAKREQLILHLFKIFYHGNTPEKARHWAGDLYDHLYWVSLRKDNHRFPDYKTIYDTLWGANEDRFSAISKGKIKRLNTLSNQRGKRGFGLITKEKDGCKEFCRSYFKWLSKQLSENGEVEEDDIKDEIDRLCKEFNLY